MASKNDKRDQQARKARAQALRQARDARNARLRGGPPPKGAGEEAATSAPGTDSSDRDPNYVDLIDERMRELDQGDA